MKPIREKPRDFEFLGVGPPFLGALAKLGFAKPTEIQRAVIPVALEGRDVLGQARTGTGKTAAFGLPLLQRLEPGKGLQAICLAPTRELATQVAAELRRLCDGSPIRIVPVYGGQKIQTQVHLLGRKPDVVVGTPGRVLDFLGRGVLNLDKIKTCVLDEVDRMLDIGFRDDIRRILSRIKGDHQTIFVSATIDEEIHRLATKYMTDPVEANVSRDELTVGEVEQYYCSVEPYDKYRLLRVLLAEENPDSAIVFCNTKHGARKLAKKLHADGINAKEIHGDLVQQKRERVMSRFRERKIKLLIATDLAARGLDISSITHIINYDLPDDCEVYVHRIGRTARMGRAGRAISFATREDGKKLTEIEKLINKLIEERRYEGFVARAPREERDPDAQARVAAREKAEPKRSVPKTLGGKFRPRRSRRL